MSILNSDIEQYVGIGGGILFAGIIGMGLWRRLRKNRVEPFLYSYSLSPCASFLALLLSYRFLQVKTLAREVTPETFGAGICEWQMTVNES